MKNGFIKYKSIWSSGCKLTGIYKYIYCSGPSFKGSPQQVICLHLSLGPSELPCDLSITELDELNEPMDEVSHVVVCLLFST